MTPCEGSSDRFDLQKIVERKKIGEGTKNDPQGKTYEGYLDMGYSMSLSFCFEKIVFELTAESFNKDEIVEIKQYIKAYKAQKEELVNYIQTVVKIKLN